MILFLSLSSNVTFGAWSERSIVKWDDSAAGKTVWCFTVLQSICKQSLDIILEDIVQLPLSIPGTVVENQAQHILKIEETEVSSWR